MLILRWLLVSLAVPAAVFGQTPVLLDAMQEELDRNVAALKEKTDPAPYFLSYSVNENDGYLIVASLGTILADGPIRGRALDVSVRVGNYTLDNYHRIRGERVRFGSRRPVPVEDTRDGIKRIIWRETDRSYRAAVERLIRVRANTQVKVAEEDDSDDFSREEPAVFVQPPAKMPISAAKWAERLKKLSAEMWNYPDILMSEITLSEQTETKYLVNSEGTRLTHGRNFARIVITAQTKAADGMDLLTSESFEGGDVRDLPDDNTIRAAIARVSKDLVALTQAPVVDPYVGPAILSGRAAGVFFHEIFGHRVEGHRQKDETEGQTFTKSVGAEVLPPFLSVHFDPTRRRFGETELNGWYSFDDEGVKARDVNLVDKGVLKTFLMSRSPIKGFNQSNGHGRKQAGMEPVSRQSNLMVESTKQVSEAKLREMLIAEIKRQNKPYGYYFQHVTGGFTTTGRAGMQAFKVVPLVVYRVYPGGRPDELVRGADIVGTPLASFAKILATSDHPEVFNGYCGADSGTVPVAAVSPALLISEIEIEKKEKSQDRPPLLPAPPRVGGAR